MRNATAYRDDVEARLHSTSVAPLPIPEFRGFSYAVQVGTEASYVRAGDRLLRQK